MPSVSDCETELMPERAIIQDHKAEFSFCGLSHALSGIALF